MREHLEDKLVLHESVGTKLKKPSHLGKRKVPSETFEGVEHSHKYGKLVRKTIELDRDADVYIERVTDIDSGEILHECVEPLSQHQGHGTAKPKP